MKQLSLLFVALLCMGLVRASDTPPDELRAAFDCLQQSWVMRQAETLCPSLKMRRCAHRHRAFFTAMNGLIDKVKSDLGAVVDHISFIACTMMLSIIPARMMHEKGFEPLREVLDTLERYIGRTAWKAPLVLRGCCRTLTSFAQPPTDAADCRRVKRLVALMTARAKELTAA